MAGSGASGCENTAPTAAAVASVPAPIAPSAASRPMCDDSKRSSVSFSSPIVEGGRSFVPVVERESEGRREAEVGPADFGETKDKSLAGAEREGMTNLVLRTGVGAVGERGPLERAKGELWTADLDSDRIWLVSMARFG